MAFSNKSGQPWLAIVSIAVTGTLFYFGNGLYPIWPLMWFAPLPVLLFALRSSWGTSAIVTTTAMLLGSLNLWQYLGVALNLPRTAWLVIFLPASIAFAAAVLLMRFLVLRGAIWSGLAAFPAMWVTLEYVRNLATPHGSAGALAYSQLRFLPFLQLASITGPWGMSFLLLLFPAGLAIAWHTRKDSPGRAVRVALTVCAALAAVLLFGAVRLAEHSTQMVRVGLIASDLNQNATAVDPGADTERLFREYGAQARKLAASGARAIVIPEKLGVAIAGQDAATDAALQSIAKDTGTTIVAGLVAVDSGVKYNQARIYEPGAAMMRYDKQHMLPPFESNLKPGTSLVTLPRAGQTWGVAICKDMDFASPARLYGQAGVGLMLVPAWDFFVDASWHGHIAIMRGVEDGFSIVRAAKGGFLTVTDNRGRILGEVSSSAAPFASLLVDVPAVHDWTVYQSLGDWFAWLNMAVFALTLLAALKVRGGLRQPEKLQS
jgi:apolipoprotein N-acyltransferase